MEMNGVKFFLYTKTKHAFLSLGNLFQIKEDSNKEQSLHMGRKGHWEGERDRERIL